MLVNAPRIDYAVPAMNKTNREATIEATPTSRSSEVLRQLHIGPTQIQRMLEAHEKGELNLDGLFHARQGARLVGAAWGQQVPGRTAVLWPPCVVDGEPEQTAKRLQRAVDRYLDSAGVATSQAIVSRLAHSDARRLRQAGYTQLADIDFIASSVDDFPDTQPESEMQFDAFPSGSGDRLARLVERTYEGTLDCQKLDDARAIQDVLVGYKNTGVYRPAWWVACREQGEDVGCVLLADHPDFKQAELIYMGIVPEMRGRGRGLQTTRFAQWIVGAAGYQQIVLAVDNSNWPAKRMYAEAGFLTWQQRRVYVRTVSGREHPS